MSFSAPDGQETQHDTRDLKHERVHACAGTEVGRLGGFSTLNSVIRSRTISSPLHVVGAGGFGEVAVVGERAGAIGAEFEHGGTPRTRALGDAVGVDVQAVGTVFRGERHLDQVVLTHFHFRRLKRAILRAIVISR